MAIIEIKPTDNPTVLAEKLNNNFRELEKLLLSRGQLLDIINECIDESQEED